MAAMSSVHDAMVSCRGVEDPAQIASVTGNKAHLLKQMQEQDKYVLESSQLSLDAKPELLNNDDNWEDFDRKFQGYLRLIPGSNGVPLLYVIRMNVVPDATPQVDCLDKYINAAPLIGQNYITDNRKVFVLLQALI